ncbi:MAG TPA: GNAT family N-acetyltransferase [Anaerolineales bacterium]|nr:GNAT family N-acetyltransferase [Anaerolineales bacterium]
MSSQASYQVHILQENETIVLPETLASSAGFVGLDSWLNFVHSIYKFPLYRLITQLKSEIDGWLALVRVKHPIFGDYLTTSPFGSYGGFAYSTVTSRDALLDKARALAIELGVQHVNVRFEAGEEIPPAGWIQHPVYATYCLELDPDPEQLLRTYSSDHRNHIRKSLKKGFSLRFGHLDLLDDIYDVLARSMHELGSPYHNKSYLRAMAEALGDTLEFAVVYNAHGELAGAGVFVFQGGVVTNLHANILQHFRSDYAGEFLYWSVIERYCRKGLKVFDLGRSLIGSGNESFKMKWKPRRQLLAYWYALMPDHALPELNQKNPKFQMAIWLWKRLPSFVVRPLGPALIKGLA